MATSDQPQPAGTILIVEDAEAIRKMVCTMLRQSGYTCLEATNGQEALRILEAEGTVQLVLTDLIMPNMGGAELAQHMAQSRPDVRIIFMSGYSDLAVLKFVEGTTAFFLPKPFTAAALAEKIRETLDRPWKGLLF